MALSPWTSGPWWQQPQEDPNRWWQTPVSPITSALSPSKSAAEETADLLKRYREALAGTTSEAPAEVMKDARKAGLAQSLIALGAGIAHGDWTGGIQAGSQALTQGYDQTIQRWAKTRDQNFDKQQTELQMALKEAELRKQAEDDRERDETSDRLLREHPELFAGKSREEIRQMTQQFNAADLARKMSGDDWKTTKTVTVGGRVYSWQRSKYGDDTRWIDSSGNEVDASVPESASVEAATTEEQRKVDAAARARAALGIKAQGNDRANELQPFRVASEEDKAAQRAAGQALAASIGADPGNWQKVNALSERVTKENQMAVDAAKRAAMFGQQTGIPLIYFPVGGQITEGENGERLINGKPLPMLPDGTVDPSAMNDPATADAWQKSRVLAQLPTLRAVHSSGANPPPVGPHAGGPVQKQVSQGSAVENLGFNEGGKAPKELVAKVAAATAAMAGMPPGPDYDYLLKQRLALMGVDMAEYMKYYGARPHR